MNENSLSGRTALVTGAAGPIGDAIAGGLHEMGANVALLDVNEDGLARAESARLDKTYLCVCDLLDPTAIDEAVARTRSHLGEVDILVNNAGILSNNKLAATEYDEWRRVLSVNLDAAFLLARAIMPGMVHRGFGRIVNMSSLAAKTGGLTAGTAYSTSKGAVSALTFSLARESAGSGVTVNGVAPAYVATPMVTEQLSQGAREQTEASIPVGRFCRPEEVAHVVNFLCHPLAGFITGEIVDINGGLLMD